MVHKKIFKIQDRDERRALREKMHEEFENILTAEQKDNFGKRAFGKGWHKGPRKNKGLGSLNLTAEQREEIRKIREEEKERILNVLTSEQKEELIKNSLW